MKKKNITLSKKLFLDKETIVELNNDLKENIVGGIAGTIKTPGIGLSGTGCGCAMQTCGIVVCSYAGGCDIGANM
jgi:hypothetical protein